MAKQYNNFKLKNDILKNNRILYVLPYSLFPVNSGNKNLTYNLLQQTVSEFECDIICLVDDNEDFNLVEKNIRNTFINISNVYVYSYIRNIINFTNIIRFVHPAFCKYFNNELVNFFKQINLTCYYDLIHFDMIHTSIYKRYCMNIKSILVASDAYSLSAKISFQHEKKLIKKIKLIPQYFIFRYFENIIYKKFEAVCFVSEKDRLFAQNNSINNFKLIKIGVDDAYLVDYKQKYNNNSFKGLLISGAIDHSANADHFIEFLMQVVIHNSKIPITIIGKNIHYKLHNFIVKYSNIVYIPYVENYVNFLNQDWIYIYPQKTGTGLQTKLQQALAVGLPVITMNISINAFNLPSDNEILFTCDDYFSMTSIIEILSNDIDLRMKYSKASSDFIKSTYSPNQIKENIFSIYEMILKI